jgi:hypothetical protein
MTLAKDQSPPTIGSLVATLFGKSALAILVVVTIKGDFRKKSFLLRYLTLKSRWWKLSYRREQSQAMAAFCRALK